MRRALLFDLDETLVVEEAAAAAAFEAVAAHAALRYDIDPPRLAAAARAQARQLWRATPVHAFCLRVGISSWEGLWCGFEGKAAETAWLRAWSPTYRREAWSLALAEQGIDDAELAEILGERFPAERRARHEVHSDAAAALAELSSDHVLGVVTNGASCLQREKLAASGLSEHFATVVVSADLGVGKPDPAIFHCALDRLGCTPSHAVMVGDSLRRDVRGAVNAGLGAVWLRRSSEQPPADDVPTIASLGELPALLAAGDAGRAEPGVPRRPRDR